MERRAFAIFGMLFPYREQELEELFGSLEWDKSKILALREKQQYLGDRVNYLAGSHASLLRCESGRLIDSEPCEIPVVVSRKRNYNTMKETMNRCR